MSCTILTCFSPFLLLLFFVLYLYFGVLEHVDKCAGIRDTNANNNILYNCMTRVTGCLNQSTLGMHCTMFHDLETGNPVKRSVSETKRRGRLKGLSLLRCLFPNYFTLYIVSRTRETRRILSKF